ncbi:DNA ligase D [Enterovirga rhinocerotis]|uniref:DNA ligase (ATP) n=1 Tax=Enterovirga rhinocerotis TaxID=1339210 RepID=A0A4R7C5J8_9HYPH|nr:DNA ligase D [Enterovirga rhinocerotis]TDR93668.1 ATP-dependent DNA ligase LigD phosphoesterase module /ATP-dependent DNA ligase LigD polymerase module [Enterovirga rhinocerotis]
MAKLAAYRAKRDFDRTAEPKGRERRKAGDGLAFVVQKHDATRLHYDLRLELDGVMKSWAVTKGPSLSPGEKRLAVHVEDHPVEYNSFEGTIPQGQYGGGTVLLWDRGHWLPEGDARKGYAKGHLEFRLDGEKLSGGWHLVRMKGKPGETRENWLLIKTEDEAARGEGEPDILDEKPLSVATGRSMSEIAGDASGKVWDSSRGVAAEARKAGATKPPSRSAARAKGGTDSNPPHAEVPAKGRPRSTRSRGTSFEAPLRGAPQDEEGKNTETAAKAPMPRSVEPCLATLATVVPKGDRWLHEIKWDGYRLIAFKTAKGVRLTTRRGLDWTKRFPAIAEAVAALPVSTAILDGEAVIEGEDGVASFSALQQALSDTNGKIAHEAVFYAFDLLHLEGHDLRPLPLEERKARLADLVPAGGTGHLRLGEHLEADGEAMVRSACRLGLEGIISKRRDRPYRSGRGDDWLKVKCTERQEFVIVGFMPSSASRRAVGSLVLAYHEEGDLRLAGRAGTGYTAEIARDLFKRLDPLRRKTPVLAARPSTDERRNVVWVEPALVAEAEFRGWTDDGRLRQAAFKGLREDKSPDEVVRERPRDLPAETAARKPARPAANAAVKRPRSGTAEIAGVALTHPERVLWPDAGITKQRLAEFYESIAAWLLPHVADRPLSLVRCPGGLDGQCFFQKHSWAGLSDHILRETVREAKGEEEVLYVRDIAGVVALVQASVLEIHPWGCTMADVERADRITMDLDPGEGVAFAEVMAAAKDVRERLRTLGLESFVKTTGGKGLHVVVPLSGEAPWPEVKAFAKALADEMAADDPGRYIAKASKSARRGLIYVDYLRNGRGATAIAAYSSRARPGAPVAVPLDWSELKASLKPSSYTTETVPARLASLKRDPWASLTELRQSLPPAKTPASRRRG